MLGQCTFLLSIHLLFNFVVTAGAVGLKTVVVLRDDFNYIDLQKQNNSPNQSTSIQGNLRLMHMAGATIYHCIRDYYKARSENEILQIAGEMTCKQDHKAVPYLMPVGGSVTRGVWGYLECVRELEPILNSGNIDCVFVSVGSGGTAAGLALGLWLDLMFVVV
jgi:1-aminocyclopropane-1-carboxylate deaminase/D-cysteine desulfhydrase-like pyridoxal-dependent ACC family enzyme